MLSKVFLIAKFVAKKMQNDKLGFQNQTNAEEFHSGDWAKVREGHAIIS